MNLKALVGFLILIAISGLVAFAALSFFEPDKSASKVEDEIQLEAGKKGLDELAENEDAINSMIISLLERKAFLEGSIDENEKESLKTQNLLKMLRAESVTLSSNISDLKEERDQLTETVSDLLIQLDNAKELEKQIVEKNNIGYEQNILKEQMDELIQEKQSLEQKFIDAKKEFNDQIDDQKKNLALMESTLSFNETKIAAIKEKYLNENGRLKEQLEQLQKENSLIKKANKEMLSSLDDIDQPSPETLLTQSQIDEINELNLLKSNFLKLNGLRVIFSGNMIYDETKGQIVFRADNSTGIPIFQDDFTGSIAGECGLPVDKEIQNRCSATIIAEFVLLGNTLFLRGKEIVEVVRK